MGISKVTRNYQVTLPADVREFKNLKVGDKVLFTIHDDAVELEKMDKKVIEKAAGLWADMEETGIEYTDRIRSEWKRRPKS